MGNTPKTKVETSRREAAAAMRAADDAARRRRNVITVAVAAVVAVAIIAAAAIPLWIRHQNDPRNHAISDFGVAAAQAGVTKETSKPAAGAGQHVQPGTVIDYPDNPPAFGQHDGEFITDPRHFYTREDRPPVEKVVHSLEHGYTVVWYDPTINGDQLQALKDLAVRVPEDKNPGRWFMVVPWTQADIKDRGAFPDGKHVAVTHWGKTDGYWQYADKVSGEMIADFIKRHPATDAPEVGGV